MHSKVTQDEKISREDKECYSPKALRHVLRLWNNSLELGQQPLAQLDIVSLHCTASSDYHQRGLALRNIVGQTIDALKPNPGPVDYMESAWYPYIILTKQYLERHSTAQLVQQMCIARSTYFREQKRAFDLLACALQQINQECHDMPPAIDDHYPPFMAPPRPIYSLVGRDALLNNIKQRLFAGGHLLFAALTGLPGVGKTALAVELAHDPEILAHFSDGVLWAGLGRQPDVLTLMGLWGTALGIQPNEISRLPDIEQCAHRIHTTIGTRRMLLVIDDAWQTETALAFKLGGPNCAYLLTTRIPEVALAFADSGLVMVPELSEDDGVTLLGRMAPQVIADELTEAHALARAVGGLPLALTLMGWHLREETYQQQPRRLQRAIKRLHRSTERFQLSHPQTPLERHPDVTDGTPLSLQVVIGISEETLNPQAKSALRALSLLPPKPNNFSEAAALAITDAPVDILDALLDRGLLESNGPERYTLHQTISDYAGLHNVADEAYTRMSGYFIRFIETHSDDYECLTLELSNLRAALDVAFDHEEPDAISAVNTLYQCLEARGLQDLAQHLLGKAEHLARELNSSLDLASTLRNLGRTALKKGDPLLAEDYLQEGLALARDIDDQEMLGALLFNLGTINDYRGDFDIAEQWYKEALNIARQIKDMERVAWLLNNLSGIAICRGNYAQTEAYCQEGLEIVRKDIPENKGVLNALLTNLGLAAKKQKDYARAKTFYEESLALAQEIGHRERVTELFCNLGNLAMEEGDYSQAEAFYREGISIAEEIGHAWLFSGLNVSLGELYVRQRRFPAARQAFQKAFDVACGSSTQEWSGLALFGLARTAAELGDMDKAHHLGAESLSLLQTMGHSDMEKVAAWLEQIEKKAAEK